MHLDLLVFSRCGTTQWDQLCAKEVFIGPQTTLQQGKEGCLITAMDNWGQLHTNATLLKPANWAKHHVTTVFSELYRAMKKPSGKSRLDYLFCSAVVSR